MYVCNAIKGIDLQQNIQFYFLQTVDNQLIAP
jgi:hypothetical protein